MRKNLRTLWLAMGLVLLASPAMAADELYPIKLYQTDHVGSLQTVHFVVEERTESTMAMAHVDPQTRVKSYGADLTGRIEATEVNDAGQSTRFNLTIEKMTRPDGRDMIKPGTVIDVSRTSKATKYTAKDGEMISDEAREIFTVIFPKPVEPKQTDRIYGSETPRKMGDSWKINSDAAAEMLATQGVIVLPKDVKGQVVLKSLQTVGGTKALRLVTTISADNLDLRTVPKGMEFNGGDLLMTVAFVQPVDMALPPLETITTMDITSRMAMPSRQAAVESKTHVVVHFSGQLLQKPVSSPQQP